VRQLRRWSQTRRQLGAGQYVSTVVYSFNVLLMSVTLLLAALTFRNGSLVLHADDDEKESVSFFPAATDPGTRVGLQVEKSGEMCQICMH